MRKLVLAAAERGHTVRIHVIGDGAIHAALDIFEEAADLYGLPQHGHNTLEHLENLLPEDIDRLRKLDVVASSQPCHITLDPGGPERDLGLERSRIMWPFATYKQRGIRQAFGTDSPITAVTSMNVLYTAITRQPKATGPRAAGCRASASMRQQPCATTPWAAPTRQATSKTSAAWNSANTPIW